MERAAEDADASGTAALRPLSDEVARLLSERGDALDAVEAVAALYKRSIEVRQRKMEELRLDADLHHANLERAHASLEKVDSSVPDSMHQRLVGG